MENKFKIIEINNSGREPWKGNALKAHFNTPPLKTFLRLQKDTRETISLLKTENQELKNLIADFWDFLIEQDLVKEFQKSEKNGK